MKILAKLIWITIAVSTAIVAAIVPIAALVGSILIPATWGWTYNYTFALAIAVGFLGFISWGFTWAGLLYLAADKLQGR